LLLFAHRQIPERRGMAIDPLGHRPACGRDSNLESDHLPEQIHVVQRPGEPAGEPELVLHSLISLEVADGAPGKMCESSDLILTQAVLLAGLSAELADGLCHGCSSLLGAV